MKVMKKVVSAFLGGFLAASSAQLTEAASLIDFSGYYRAMYMSETNTGYGPKHGSFTDSYFQDRFNIEMTFRPTDEIAVHWRMRTPSSYRRWGSQDVYTNLETHFVYGEIKQNWGTILVGRLSDDLDVYGLAALGYQPAGIPVYTNVGPFDRADIFDGIRYSHAWDNGFSIMAQYGKLDNKGKTGGLIQKEEVGSGGWVYVDGRTPYIDQDYDRYQVQAAYAWDGGGLALNVAYDRNATGNAKDQHLRGNPYGWGYYGVLKKTETWSLNPAFMHSWGSISLHFEGMAAFGRANYIMSNAPFVNRDGQGYGAYLDFDYNYGPGNATLAAWWVSGTELNDVRDVDNKSKSLVNLVGGNFYPLLVAYNGLDSTPGGSYVNGGYNISAIGMANNGYENYVKPAQTFYSGSWNPVYMSLNGVDLNMSGSGIPSGFVWDVLGTSSDRAITSSFNNGTETNHWAIALTGNHAFTDDISMHYGLAYLALNEPNYRVVQGSTFHESGLGEVSWNDKIYREQDKDLGFEIDLGFSFQLLDNLQFVTAFGYMFNGKAYKELKGYRLNDNDNSGDLSNGDSVEGVWENAADSYVWFNSLTFSF
ncbi:hypothetical protein C4J81_16820 [Deltaproteobacteria bacterium Smac51]|nr:hypothetical protein C4J81_16820 [Deltaproteobacteria bacterium Smac51]